MAFTTPAWMWGKAVEIWSHMKWMRPPSILQRQRAAAIGHMGDVGAHQGVEQHGADMQPGTGAG